MLIPNFTHLFVNLDYSIGYSCAKILDLVQRAKELGMTSLALTDRGVMCGILEFVQECRKAGIKPIIGQMFFCTSKNDATLNHIILLCKNETGYRNLCQLSSISWTKRLCADVPYITLNCLAEYSTDLVCIVLPQYEDFAKAETFAVYCKNVFNDGNLFIAIENNSTEQAQFNKRIVDFANDKDIPLVAVNEILYINKDDALTRMIFSAQHENRCLPRDITVFEGSHYLKSADEMAVAFAEYPEALENTQRIAQMCDVKMSFSQQPDLPNFDVPVDELSNQDIQDKYEQLRVVNENEPEENKKSEEELIHLAQEEIYLRKLVFEGIKQRYGDDPSREVIDRMNDELATICKSCVQRYFLIVYDYVKYARDHGIRVGAGRGASAGSIVNYALGITNVDPLENGLLFERFFNLDSIDMPDIETDFCHERLGEVVEYISRKYGVDRVSRIVTFSNMKSKQTVRDAGRVLNVPLEDVNGVIDSIPDVGKTIAEKM